LVVVLARRHNDLSEQSLESTQLSESTLTSIATVAIPKSPWTTDPPFVARRAYTLGYCTIISSDQSIIYFFLCAAGWQRRRRNQSWNPLSLASHALSQWLSTANVSFRFRSDARHSHLQFCRSYVVVDEFNVLQSAIIVSCSIHRKGLAVI
jgi:hypothetical protein